MAETVQAYRLSDCLIYDDKCYVTITNFLELSEARDKGEYRAANMERFMNGATFTYEYTIFPYIERV